MSNTLRSALALGAAVACASHALAQAPFYADLPIPHPDYKVESMSANGRYITGHLDEAAFAADLVYRYDRTTGAYHVSPIAVDPGGGAAVIDDGRVFCSTAYFGGNEGRIFRWNPDTGQVTYAPRNSNPMYDDIFYRVSRDGLYAVGVSWEYPFNGSTGNGVLADFSSDPPFIIDLLNATPEAFLWHHPGPFAGVTQPINGVRYIYGNLPLVLYANPVAFTWVVGNAQPTRDHSWTAFHAISPRAEVQLGNVNGQFVVRGNGADRVLTPPIFPVQMNTPSVIAMSDDGRVVGGWAVNPEGSPVGSEPVVWRTGQQPITLRQLLLNAGVPPAPEWNQWFAAGIYSVSADGSTVAGTYHGTPPGSRGFVAVLPAANNSCETARSITYGTIIDSTNGASRAGVSGGCFSEGTAPDVWFSFVPAANETVTIDACGSAFDTTLTVFQASTCGALGAPLICNDNATPACPGNALNSRVSASVFAGQNYFIRVSGINGAFGSIQLTITAPNRPSNDTCATPVSLGNGLGQGAFFNNMNAITDPRPSCPGSGTPFNDLWFECTPLETGRMTYSTCGSSFTTVVSAYPESACSDPNVPALGCVQGNAGCGGGIGTRLTVECRVGQTQLVRVGGLFGASGEGRIVARFACDANVLSGYALSVVNLQPRGYWRFEDSGAITVADAMRADPFSCGNYPGQRTGLAYRGRGPQGQALAVSGSGDVRVPDAPHVTDPAACPDSNFGATLEAWIRTTDPAAGVVLTNRTAPGEHSLTLVVGYNPIGIPNTAGRVLFVSDGPGVFFGGGSTVRVDDGDWHHVVGRRVVNAKGNIELQVWIDGVQSWSELAGVGFTYSGVNGNSWVIGNGPAWPAQDAPFNGSIDEVAIYCGAMNPGDIVNHSNLGRPCPADFNESGIINSQDFFDFLNAFFIEHPSADFNEDGVINSQDFFDFLAAFFGGC